MQIVIDISDIDYSDIKEYGTILDECRDDIAKAIINGKPLPKGHGKLKDISKIDEDRIDDNNPIIYLTINGEDIEAVSLRYLDNLPTIIEADTAESEVSDADSD